MPLGSLDIVVGASWKDDPRYLVRLSAYHRDAEPFDFSPVLDIVDIVVDGANLTSTLPEESIFPVVHELAVGLEALVSGRSDKLIVAFREAPWELAVQPAAEHFAVSFYATGSSREVALHNRLVPRTHLIDSTIFATEGVLDGLLAVNDAFASDELVQELVDALRKLRHARLRGGASGGGLTPQPEPAAPGERRGDAPGEVLVRAGDRRLRLDLRFDATHGDLWRYHGGLAADRHSLLFTGSLHFCYWGRSRQVAASTYVFPVLGALVTGAERMLAALEQGVGGAVLLDTGHGVVSLLTAELLDVDHALVLITEPSGSHGQTNTTPARILRVITDVVRATIAAILELNPRQGLNEPICELEQRLARLEGHARDVLLGDTYFDDVQRYLREAPTVEALAEPEGGDEPEFAHPLSAMRHIFVRSSWHLVRNHLDLAGLRVTARDVFVPSAGWVDCVERATGMQRWRRAADSLLALTSEALFTSRERALSAWRSDDGAPIWAAETDAAVELVIPLSLDERPLLVVASEGGNLDAFDALDGRPQWRTDLEHGEVSGLCVAGAVLVATGDDDFVHGLDPASGRSLWKVRVPGDAALPPFFHEGRLYVCADRDPGYEGVLYSLSPLTGRRVFERRLASAIAAQPLMVGRTGVFSLECPGAAVVQAVDLETGALLWSRPLETAQLDAPTLTWAAETLIVKTDEGMCLGLDLATGEERWSTDLLDPGEVLLANVAPVRQGDQLVIAERWVSLVDPKTGARRARLREVPEHPGFLHVGADLSLLVGDGDDHLECFDLRGFLALL